MGCGVCSVSALKWSGSLHPARRTALTAKRTRTSSSLSLLTEQSLKSSGDILTGTRYDSAFSTHQTHRIQGRSHGFLRLHHEALHATPNDPWELSQMCVCHHSLQVLGRPNTAEEDAAFAAGTVPKW